MANIRIRPDLRTAGGEVNDILFNGKYAGTLSLVYREGVRISGSVQLEKESLSAKEKDRVIHFVRTYVQSLIDALQAKQCDVLVTFSAYDHIIATGDHVGRIREFVSVEEGPVPGEYAGNVDYVTDEPQLVDVDPYDREILEMEDAEDDDTVYYELVQVGQSREGIEYHVYDQDERWIAEAFATIYDTDVVGEINWMVEPSDEQIEHIADLFVSDFNEDEIETFVLDMNYKGELLETIELARDDIMDQIELLELEEESQEVSVDEEYSVMLSRDDGDTLTYDIYQHSFGGLPIGSATVDISRREMTGFIDFREPGSSEDREQIASVLMRELDKEREFDSFNLTMLYQNEPIDEMLFENETVH